MRSKRTPGHELAGALLLVFGFLLMIAGMIGFGRVIMDACDWKGTVINNLKWIDFVIVGASMFVWASGIVMGYFGDYFLGKMKGLKADIVVKIILYEAGRGLTVILAILGLLLAVVTSRNGVEEIVILTFIIGSASLSLLTWMMGKSVQHLRMRSNWESHLAPSSPAGF